MKNKKTQTAYFGAGCFWGVEQTFREKEGIVDVKVGYAGGDKKSPSYEQVCSGETGHAEVVKVLFDPDKISYDELLNIFWVIHDPTQLNRQGPDVGNQYRSLILFDSEEQKEKAENSKKSQEEKLKGDKSIKTVIEPFKEFFLAEEYHQRYLEKKGGIGCGI